MSSTFDCGLDQTIQNQEYNVCSDRKVWSSAVLGQLDSVWKQRCLNSQQRAKCQWTHRSLCAQWYAKQRISFLVHTFCIYLKLNVEHQAFLPFGKREKVVSSTHKSKEFVLSESINLSVELVLRLPFQLLFLPFSSHECGSMMGFSIDCSEWVNLEPQNSTPLQL